MPPSNYKSNASFSLHAIQMTMNYPMFITWLVLGETVSTRFHISGKYRPQI